jgi:hypothetical protein
VSRAIRERALSPKKPKSETFTDVTLLLGRRTQRTLEVGLGPDELRGQRERTEPVPGEIVANQACRDQGEEDQE